MPGRTLKVLDWCDYQHCDKCRLFECRIRRHSRSAVIDSKAMTRIELSILQMKMAELISRLERDS